MKTYNITAVNKQHFNSLIQDYKANGFALITLKENVAELQSKTESIIITYIK